MIDARYACARHNRDAAINAAADRDERDRCKLIAIHDEVLRTLDALLPYTEDMEHPNARWHPRDLLDALTEQARSIRHEQHRLCGPLVLDEAA